MTSTTSGGVGRILYMANTEGNAVDTNNMEVTDQNSLTPAPIQVDSKDAVLLIISDENINALLTSPLTAELLDNTGVPITYADSPTITTTTTATAINARADGTMRSGSLYSLAVSGGNSGTTSIYIDDHAPVVLGYEEQGDNLELTMIGEPLPTAVTDFSGTYSGFAAATRILPIASSIISRTTNFKMVVGFANGESTITSFAANFGATHGSISASNIPINANATFTSADGGTVTFTAATDTVTGTITTGGSGTLLGQFHGTTANGVTGAFHNSANTVLGGFAGSKE